MKVFAPKSAYRAKQDGTWDGLAYEIASLPDSAAVEAWEQEFLLRRHRTLPENWQDPIREALADRKSALLHDGFDDAYRATMGDVL